MTPRVQFHFEPSIYRATFPAEKHWVIPSPMRDVFRPKHRTPLIKNCRKVVSTTTSSIIRSPAQVEQDVKLYIRELVHKVLVHKTPYSKQPSERLKQISELVLTRFLNKYPSKQSLENSVDSLIKAELRLWNRNSVRFMVPHQVPRRSESATSSQRSDSEEFESEESGQEEEAT